VSGVVYFIGPEALLHRRDGSALVKIGFTRSNPLQRLRALQTGSPLTLRLWAYVEGSESLEAAFHSTFAELRSHGEWFFVQDKLEVFLRYLGEEPHIGRLIPREQMEVAIYDSLVCDVVPHPSYDPRLYALSGKPDSLFRHFPEAFQ
jgi:hypothetical protein